MSLKVELKPHERVIVGNCVITNSDQRARLFIDGNSPILREKDILTPATANSPAKRVYLAVQIMYLEDNIEATRADYFTLVGDIVAAAPSCIPLIDEINNEILTGQSLQGLKAARRLIQHEQDILSNAAAGGLGISVKSRGRRVPRETSRPISFRNRPPTCSACATTGTIPRAPSWPPRCCSTARLWTVFMTSVTRDDSPLPVDLRQNIANLGIFIMKHSLALAGRARAAKARRVDQHQPPARRRPRAAERQTRLALIRAGGIQAVRSSNSACAR